MREIKCRGKSIRTGKWVFGYFYDQKSINVDFKAYYNSFILTNQEKGAWKEQVIPESVGQLTGKKDKNQTDIHENDVCLYSVPDDCFKRTFLVKWDDKTCAFSLVRYDRKTKEIWDEPSYRNIGELCFDNHFNQYLEVIGNTFEQDELVKAYVGF